MYSKIWSNYQSISTIPLSNTKSTCQKFSKLFIHSFIFIYLFIYSCCCFWRSFVTGLWQFHWVTFVTICGDDDVEDRIDVDDVADNGGDDIWSIGALITRASVSVVVEVMGPAVNALTSSWMFNEMLTWST